MLHDTPLRSRPRLVAVLLAVAVVSTGAPSAAFAQKANVSQKDRREAKRLFNQAHLAYRRGDYEEAILKWEQSFELSGEPLIYLSIANAYERLGDPERALDYLTRWRDKAPRREHEELDQRLESLQRRVDDKRAEDERRAREEEERRAKDDERRERERQQKLEELRKQEQSGTTDVWTITGWSMVGVGGAAVVAGLIVDGVAAAKRPSEDEACTDSGDGLLCRDALRDDIESSNTLAIAGDVTWIVGGVIAAGGVVVLLTLAGDDEPDESAATIPRVVPLVGPRGGGLGVSGRF